MGAVVEKHVGADPGTHAVATVSPLYAMSMNIAEHVSGLAAGAEVHAAVVAARFPSTPFEVGPLNKTIGTSTDSTPVPAAAIAAIAAEITTASNRI